MGQLGSKSQSWLLLGALACLLAMLMKLNPLVSVIHLYDVVNSPGVTADITHMDTGAVVIFHYKCY